MEIFVGLFEIVIFLVFVVGLDLCELVLGFEGCFGIIFLVKVWVLLLVEDECFYSVFLLNW